MFLLACEGVFIGITLGLTGAGGGILAIPLLMWSQSWSVAQAAPIALIATTIASGAATIQGLWQHKIRYRAAIWMALFSIPSVYLGVTVSKYIPASYITILLCIVMVISACRYFMKTPIQSLNLCRTNKVTQRFIWNHKTKIYLGGLGITLGIVTGILGVGGGFILMPILKKISDLSIYCISATSLMTIFLVGLITLITQISSGYHYALDITFVFVFTALIGLFIGRFLQNYLHEHIIYKFFAVLLICIASITLYRLI
ncbi:sulfite exporter TauE/SafE family protein [Acinetobacter sp. B5B]|uniref:sulfite exporter TauE/SafE family protein n=1 Tax=Acinetobacter baretiae TaxID=2605383 RepID=UPI0018C2FC17|nr:sulfite exporter TauE/SafE family protein [Acinetobacter baretiae]MBF7682407.1 sulfite exporter TauE/SafE family protein [Acinetobacter baretiae]